MKRKWAAVLLGGLLAVLTAAIVFMGAELHTMGQERRELDAKAREKQAESDAAFGITGSMTEEEKHEKRMALLRQSWDQVVLSPFAKAEGGKLVVTFSNSAESKCRVSMAVTAVNEYGNRQVIASTGAVDPGYYVRELDLLAELPEGETRAMAKVTFALLNGEEVGTMGQQMVITKGAEGK